MGLAGPHVLGHSDGLDHYSFCIRSWTRMERPTVANSGFSMAPLRIRLVFYTVVAGGLALLPSFLVYTAAIFASLIVSLPWLKGKLILPAE